MKKKLLPLAMLAGLAGAAGTAQAVYINTDGLGESLIYPFYSVENGQNTYINITNTTNYYKAVKVRILEGQNSAEVLDFNVYLSPQDIWTGAIVPEGEGAKIITRDNSCTIPRIPRPTENEDGVLVGADGVSFRDYVYAGDGGDQSISRTNEGYIEVLEMGVIIGQDEDGVHQGDIRHDPSGMPANCDGLRAHFLASGVTPPAGSSNYDDPTSVVGTGIWLVDPNDGFAEQEDHNATYMLGGLYGYGVIVNPNEGSGAGYNAVALDQFYGMAVVEGEYNSQHTDPGTVFPNLGDAYEVAQVISGNQIVDTEFNNGWDAVSALFMHDTLSNDFVLDSFVNADTDWVITMPTKRHYVNTGITKTDDGDVANDPLPPFTKNWTKGSCEVVGIEIWDREEAVTQVTGDIDFSPRPPSGTGPEPSTICSEVNVISFGSGSALYPSERIGYGLADVVDHENGWVRLTFSNGEAGERELLNFDGDIAFEGLPVTGFAVQKFINGSADGGALANYAWLVDHNYTRSIVDVVGS